MSPTGGMPAFSASWTPVCRKIRPRVAVGGDERPWKAGLLHGCFRWIQRRGRVLGQIESPGPHSIDVGETGELFASGRCCGSNPNGFSWLLCRADLQVRAGSSRPGSGTGTSRADQEVRPTYFHQYWSCEGP